MPKASARTGQLPMTEQVDDSAVRDRTAATWPARIWRVARWVVLAAAVWYLWREGALSRDRLRLSETAVYGLTAALLFQAANTALIAFRCHCLFRCLGAPSGLGRQLRLHFSGLLAQQVGSELAYDAMRLLGGSRMGGRGTAVFAALMADRLLGLVALTALTIASLALFWEGIGWVPAVSVAAVVSAVVPLAFAWWHGKTAGNPESRLWRVPGAGLASAIGGAMLEFRRRGATLAALLVVSVAAHLCMFAALYFCGSALENCAVTAGEALTGWALSTFTGILPLPMAGLGVGETAFGETVAKLRGAGAGADFAPVFLVNRLLVLTLGTLSWFGLTLFGGGTRNNRS